MPENIICHSRPIRPGFVFACTALLVCLLCLLPLNSAKSEVLSLEQWMDLGWDYYNAGNLDEAFNTFVQTVGNYPDSAEAHLALGETYLERGIIDRGRGEILESLRLDDATSVAARAHYVYALSIREEDPWEALLHLDRAHLLGGTPTLQFDIAHQIRFCHSLIQMPERSQSGPVVLHYADYLITQPEADDLALKAESSLYLVENFCYFDLTEEFHIFLYPSERAIRAEILYEENDNDPEYREYHVTYEPDLDFLHQAGMQVIADLQDDMNRHAGASWIMRSLPGAVTRTIEWEKVDGTTSTKIQINIDEAVRALDSQGALIELKYLLTEDLGGYIPDSILKAECGSFLRWIRDSYDMDKFREILTQPNIDIVLDEDLDAIEQLWLQDVRTTESLISDPGLANEWVTEQPLSPLAGDAQLPMKLLREGLALYLNGEVTNGIWQIQQALSIDPGLALGYYTLGWIAIDQQNWDEAESRLAMAAMLFSTPQEIAWCHSMLAPIYLFSARWDLAYASLNYVASYSDSESAIAWAAGLIPRVGHIMTLRPEPIDPASPEFADMVGFFDAWDIALNEEGTVEPLTSDLMDAMNKSILLNFYIDMNDLESRVVLRHEVVNVGISGSSMYAEVRLFGEFPESLPALDVRHSTLREEGYLLYFQVIPGDNGWVVLDWEDGWFPIAPIQQFAPQNPGITEDPAASQALTNETQISQ